MRGHDEEADDSRGRGSEPPDPGSEGAEARQARFVRLAILFYGAMMAVALIWRTGVHGESIVSVATADAADVPAEPFGLVAQAGLGLLVGLVVVAGSHVATRLTRWGEALARRLGEAIGPISIPNALLLAMASGLGEELFFRGALQPRVGLVLASLLFGAAHFVPSRDLWPWSMFALVVGLLFGALFDWTGTLVAPVVAHTVVNAINLPMIGGRYADRAHDAGRGEAGRRTHDPHDGAEAWTDRTDDDDPSSR